MTDFISGNYNATTPKNVKSHFSPFFAEHPNDHKRANKAQLKQRAASKYSL